MDNLYKHVRSCGPFQIYHSTLTQFTRFASAWALSVMVFGSHDPGWTCLEFRDLPNSSDSSMQKHETRYNETCFVASNASSHGNDSSCEFIDLCDVVEFNSFSKTIVSEYKLICHLDFVPSIIICIMMIGQLFGALVSGQIGEWFGRKVSLYSSIALSSISCLLAIFSSSWQIYSVFQFLNGAGIGGIMATWGVYGMEFLDQKWRARLASIPTFNISLVLFAGVIYLLRNWIHIHISVAVICALACIGYIWTPESLRWLLLHKKDHETKVVVEQLLKQNNSPINITDAIDMLSVGNSKNNVNLDRKYTYIDLFRNRHITLVTIKLSIVWVSSILTYYALTFGIKSLTGDFYQNVLISGVSEIPSLLLVAPFTNRFGCRKTIALFMFLGSLSCITVVFAHYVVDEDVSAIFTTYSTFFIKASAIISYNTLVVFTVELFPTAVRSVGMASANIAGRVGAILSPFLIPRDRSSLIISYTVMGVALFLNMAVTLSLPETKDKSLKDNLADDEMKKQSENVNDGVL